MKIKPMDCLVISLAQPFAGMKVMDGRSYYEADVEHLAEH